MNLYSIMALDHFPIQSKAPRECDECLRTRVMSSCQGDLTILTGPLLGPGMPSNFVEIGLNLEF